MKKLHKNKESLVDSLDKCWDQMPVKKQHSFILYFFAGYLLLTAGVLLQVCCATSNSDHHIPVEHIKNPVFEKKESPAYLQDTLPLILKNKIYERK
ncbi:hypothetical protein L1276_000927 [Flavobacterium sp. HSC-32F16]|uniref:nitrogen regulatory IIA protein n=1 Tax=Flavobacterium sp. HSC-32F16 TaxID=2910964 RepID=UPI0020A5D5E6|nr:nitrogen regulatory IIA protein [Flavobacterium sp. HSC-32F16]MCP2025787.1 hypothetical protein [Flavobacterium sp. HSC-32F16]